MATIAQVSKDRKNVLRAIGLQSKALDTAQEALEREIKRLLNRRRAVPEIADMKRIAQLADKSAQALDLLVGKITQASEAFRV